MANIGLAYTNVQMAEMLFAPPSRNEVLLGLVFEPDINGNSIEFKIRRAIRTLNATVDPIKFSSVITGPNAQKESLYREDNGVLKPANNPSHYESGDELQFFDSNFSFFYTGAIFGLIDISDRIIISGADLNSGMMAFPPSTGLGPRNGTLKMEVDRENLNIGIGVRDDEIPAAIVATPCPPWWNPRK